MRLQDIMKESVETVRPGDTGDAAWERMREKRIRHLVVMEGRQVAGILSQRDIASAEVRKNRAVADLMSAPAVTAEPRTTVREAANLLRGRTLGCLPVLANGKLKGIVTTTDLLELLGRGAEHPMRQAGRRLERGSLRRVSPGSRSRASTRD
ncbi:MAG TPA: CBS domain-containing protein [Thermoanaerobaculia bacterium]|nr:CBS domain-containing protein [Thermoanaerobaculia bacterium]